MNIINIIFTYWKKNPFKEFDDDFGDFNNDLATIGERFVCLLLKKSLTKLSWSEFVFSFDLNKFIFCLS